MIKPLRALVSTAALLCCGAVVASPAMTSAFTRTDSLFIIAATGEPRFQAARDSAESLLRAEGAKTLNWLVDTATMRPHHPLTPRQSHYVERLFTVIADSGRDSTARLVVARAIATAHTDTIRARWLYIGSRIGDTAVRSVARPWLADSSEAVRRMAARVLGAYPHASDIPRLWAQLEGGGGAKVKTGKAVKKGTALSGFERHMVLWALAEQTVFKDTSLTVPARINLLKRLAPLLADDQVYNRRKVRDLMLKLSDSSWTFLARARPQTMSAQIRREWWLLAAETKTGSGAVEFLKTESKKMNPEDLRLFGL